MIRCMVKCWCGMEMGEKAAHYPSNDPECGPAHYPKPPCPDCGMEPHIGACYEGEEELSDIECEDENWEEFYSDIET